MQGMDPQNERKVFLELVRAATGEGSGYCNHPPRPRLHSTLPRMWKGASPWTRGILAIKVAAIACGHVQQTASLCVRIRPHGLPCVTGLIADLAQVICERHQEMYDQIVGIPQARAPRKHSC